MGEYCYAATPQTTRTCLLLQGPIKEAEELAAEAFGAKKTWFLVNGR